MMMLPRALNAHRNTYLIQGQVANILILGRLILHLNARAPNSPPTPLVLLGLSRSRHPDRCSQSARPRPHSARISPLPPLLQPLAPHCPPSIPPVHVSLRRSFHRRAHCPAHGAPTSDCACDSEALGPRAHGSQLRGPW